jgi:hypothetical protein
MRCFGLSQSASSDSKAVRHGRELQQQQQQQQHQINR